MCVPAGCRGSWQEADKQLQLSSGVVAGSLYLHQVTPLAQAHRHIQTDIKLR